MSSQTDFYTIDGQEALSVFSITSEVAGREIQYAFDHNLNTYWEATNTADQTITLDLGAAKTIEGMSAFLRNYDINLDNATNAKIELWHGTSTSGPWTLLVTITLAVAHTIGKPIVMSAAASEQTKQYWQIRVVTPDPVIQISHLFLWQKRSITTDSYYPEADQLQFGQRRHFAHGRRQVQAPMNRIDQRQFQRRWMIVGNTDRATLQSVISESSGRHLPLIIQEDSDEPMVVEIIDRTFDTRKWQHQMFNPFMNFKTLPYFEPGASV